TCEMPRRTTSCALRALNDISCSPSRARTSPSEIWSSPEIARANVVLPAPFGPTSATVEPLSTVNDARSTIFARPRNTVTSRTSSIGLDLRTQIRSHYTRVGLNLLGGASRDHLSCIERNDLRYKAKHRLQAVLNDNDGHASVA